MQEYRSAEVLPQDALGKRVSGFPTQPLPALRLECAELFKLRFDVLALLREQRTMVCQHFEKLLQLRGLVLGAVVHVDQLTDFRQRQAQPLAAQGEFEPRAVATRIDARTAGATPLRRQQALVFVEADRARRDVEFLRELTDGEGLGGGQGLQLRLTFT